MNLINEKFDVIVGGGGNAALAAAITACERGRRVLVVVKDKRWQRGGHSKYAECMLTAHEEGWYGLKGYSEEDYFKAVVRSVHGRTDLINTSLLKLIIRRSKEYAEFAHAHGIRFLPEGARLRIVGGGQGLVNHYYHWLEKRSDRCKVIYDAEIQKINVDGDTFKSVEVVLGGRQRITISGDNLILATGGFEGNVELMKKIWGEKFEYIRFRGTLVNTGIPIFEMVRNGAATVGRMNEGLHPIVDARVPKFEAGVIARDYSIPYSIVVNALGQRIFDEGNYAGGVSEVTYTRILLEQPEGKAFSIFDRKVWGLFKPHAYPPFKDYTIEGLARQINLDPQALIKVVKEFNSHIVPGKDCTQGLDPPKSKNARPIDTPPFYAYPLAPGFSFTRYSLKVDERARVLRVSNKPFTNVFAAGNTMIGNILTEDEYLGCFDIVVGGVVGMIAGENV